MTIAMMTGNQEPAATQVRFVALYDAPSDIDTFERHYNDVHIPLARQLPGLRRHTRSFQPPPVMGEPYYMVAMLDRDDMAALEAAFRSTIGQRTAEDAATLARYTTMRCMILKLNEV
jgi:uncharacterized protein (TIGR02118 family)